MIGAGCVYALETLVVLGAFGILSRGGRGGTWEREKKEIKKKGGKVM